MSAARAPAVAFHDREPTAGDFKADVLAGLSRPRKRLSPKYFYDARGSELFDRICELDEYYLTRAELEILARRGEDIATRAGAGAILVEFGSGGNDKIGALLDALERPAAYVALDISRDYLMRAAEDLASTHPELPVVAICADYTAPLALPPFDAPGKGARLGLFFGSTIGNLSPIEAVRFLGEARRTLGPGGAMLVGVDLKKDAGLLEAAYDDAEGVTAAFNLNLLARINRELDADFDLDAFAHRARYDAGRGRIEMHLESRRAQSVRVGDRRFAFAAGETIHTENSYKYAIGEFQEMARAAGFAPAAVWTDAGALFSLHYLRGAAP